MGKIDPKSIAAKLQRVTTRDLYKRLQNNDEDAWSEVSDRNNLDLALLAQSANNSRLEKRLRNWW